MNFLNNVSVLILGLGESGWACVQFAARYGAAQIRVADTRLQPPNLEAIQTLPKVEIVLGTLFEVSLLAGMTHIVISPGITPTQADLLLVYAKAHHITVYSELDWFALALADLQANTGYTPTVLGITGTNGKTTVTELTTHLCNEAGIAAVACGNISPAALTALMAALDHQQHEPNQRLPEVWVLELSSFQLHYTHALPLKAAALLNLTQDHLDWHANMDEYGADKARIFEHTAIRVLNRDDAACQAYCVLPAGLATKVVVQTFGLTPPDVLGDMGCQTDGIVWLTQAIAAQNDIPKLRRQNKAQKHTALELPVAQQRLMPADALRLRGSHNHANALAALLLAQAAGISLAKALHGLRSYAGAAYRCELVQIIHDVEYINDSKGTNVGATVAALIGLSDQRQRLVLILGGVGKGQDFSPLALPVARFCKAVILIGHAAPELAVALAQTGVPLHPAIDLHAAVQHAATLACTGDAVLLSPACSSFDMFKSYAHRAQVFVEAVQALNLNLIY